MKVAISVIRPFHATLMANALSSKVERVCVLSSATRGYFRGLDPGVSLRLIPAPVQILERVLPFPMPREAMRAGLIVWDALAAAALPDAELVVGFATQGLSVGRRAKRRGSQFLLDRACPHVDVQQRIIREEAEKVGANAGAASGAGYGFEPPSFRERQLQEYALADAILVPSQYTARSFPPALRHKLVLAPLLGRGAVLGGAPPQRDRVFTVGVLGGNPLRKGFLYLLEAWKRLALPNARLLLRHGGDFAEFPRLAELLHDLPNVERIGYVSRISDFYGRCDVFCLPSVDDGFGMALCEAMAHGVACVATRHCGASELMCDGVDGLVVAAQDVEALMSALLRLYEDEEMRESMAVAGQQTMIRIVRERRYERALVAAVHSAPSG